MNNHLYPDNIISTRELNGDEKNLKQRWQRVKDYLPSDDENKHWQNALRDVEAILRDSKCIPLPGTWHYGALSSHKF